MVDQMPIGYEVWVAEDSLILASGREPLQRRLRLGVSGWPLPQTEEHFEVCEVLVPAAARTGHVHEAACQHWGIDPQQVAL